MCCLSILSPAWAARRWEPALLLMPCVLVITACMNYFDTLLFIFFARDEGEIYKTTATLEDGGEAG